MRTVYAIQFSVDPAAGEVGSKDFMNLLRSSVENWIEEGYQRRWGEEIKVELPCSEWSPMEHHSIVASVQQDEDQDLTTFNWAHLDQEDSNLVWRTEGVFARNDQDVDLNVRVRITSPRFELRPIPEYFVGRPRFVTEVLSHFSCRVGEQPIPTATRHVHVGEVEEFVDSVLESEDRSLPVVLLSQSSWSERPYTDPDALLERMLGHAIVAEIDKHAGFDLTALVGKRFSCWGGAIRVYWPGFDRDGDDFHPLFLPNRMDHHRDRGTPIEDHLFNRLSAIAILRHTEGPTTRAVRAHFLEQRRSELAQLRAQLEAKEQEGSQALEETEEQLLHALVQVDELKEENERLQGDLDAAHENLADVARHWDGSSESEESVEAEQDDFRPDSVLEAAVEAGERYKDTLEIWNTAYDSAAESDFVRPSEVFDAFTALAELSREYFRSLDEEEAMGPWDNFFADRGLRYSPSEHGTTMTMYGDQRTFTRGTETRTMERHLTLGGGSRKNCVQIYFQKDQERRTIHVGYCGRHLDFASQQT